MDARYSGYMPVLIVLDPTENAKLSALSVAFKKERGEVYVGEKAWAHLEAQAGPIMSGFVEKYVRAPMESLLAEEPPTGKLPDFGAVMKQDEIIFRIGKEELRVQRCPASELEDGDEILPEDVDEG